MQKKTVEALEVRPIILEQGMFELVSTERMVTHRFAEKAMKLMLEKQMGLTPARSTKKEPKNPTNEFVGGLYNMGGPVMVCGEFDASMLETMEYGIPVTLHEPEGMAEGAAGASVPSVYAIGKFGFPSVGLKAAIATAGIESGITKSTIHRTVRIPGDLQEIQCEPGPCMRIDMVRLSGASGVADIRFRPDFREWKANVLIQYDGGVLKLNHIVDLLRRAGFGVGLGEWRPERGGQWGTFDVVKVLKLPPVEVKYEGILQE